MANTYAKPGILFSLLAFFVFFSSCSKDDLPGPETGSNTGQDEEIWMGSSINFTKENDADPNLAENQDRITDKVWLTRDNEGGQIFNIQSESIADKDNSPAGTLWAEGTLDQIDDLQFRLFRAAVGRPKNVVGKNLVLYLVEDNIYLSVRFTSWSEQKGGGFSYERSTPQ